jgi:hypothetical protein
MPSPEVLNSFIAKVETNEHAEAIEQFYAANASMQENDKRSHLDTTRPTIAGSSRRFFTRQASIRESRT